MSNFISTSFSTEHAARYDLAIQADLKGLSLCVIHHDNGGCMALKSYAYTVVNHNDLDTELHKIFRQEDLLKLVYRRCICLFVSEKSTLIPNELFAREHLHTYLSFAVSLDDLDEIHYKTLSAVGATDVFAIPAPLAQLLHTYHHKVDFFHQSVPLIHLLHDHETQNGIALHFTHTLASFAVVAKKQFVLSNTFAVETFTDAVYYLGYIMKQLQLFPETTDVYLTGNISGDNTALLSRYYPNITVLGSDGVACALNSPTAAAAYRILAESCICG
jgi:hypothetical protein